MLKFTLRTVCMAIIIALCAGNLSAQVEKSRKRTTNFSAERVGVSKQGSIGQSVLQAIPSIKSKSSATSPSRAPRAIYSEGFEGTTGVNLPAGWTTNPTAVVDTEGIWGGGSGVLYDMLPPLGDRCATITTYQEDDVDAWMFSSAINLTAGTTYVISWWLMIFGDDYGTDNDRLDVRISQTQSIAGMESGTSIYYTETEVAFDWIQKTAYFTPTESGDYYVGFHCTTLADLGWFIGVDDFAVSIANDNDLQVNKPPVYPYTQVPVSQFLHSPISTQVTNIGMLPQSNVTLSISHGGTVAGTSDPIATLAPGASANLSATVSNKAVQLGENIITYIVSQDETDEDLNDNKTSIAFTGTNHIFAVDDNNYEWRVGNSSPISLGNIFTINNATELNAVELDFGQTNTNINFTVSLYAMNGNVPSSPAIFTTGTQVKPAVGGLIRVTVPTTTLEAGKSYFLCANQIGNTSYGIKADGNPNRVGYLIYGTQFMDINSGFGDIIGAVMIRMAVDLSDNDLQVTAPIYPYTQVPTFQGLYSPLSAQVSNVGLNAQSNVILSVSNGGTVVGTSAPLATLARSANATLSVTATSEVVHLGENTLTYTVSQDETDAYLDDNESTATFIGTDHILAIDNDDPIYIVGNTSPISLGNIFTINKTAMLNAAELSFDETDNDINYTVSLYAVNGNTINLTAIFTTENQIKPAAGGWAKVIVPETVLEAGKSYYLCANQTGNVSFGINTDGNPNSIGYLLFGTQFMDINTGYNDVLGAVMIRMVMEDFVTVATEANGITLRSFNANWNAIDAADDYLLSVYTKEGGTSAPVTVLSENFGSITSGNNTETGGSSSRWSGNDNFSEISNANNVFQAGGVVRLGTGSLTGSLTTKELDLSGGTVTVSFDVKGWTTLEGTSILVSIDGGTPQTVAYTALMANDFEQQSVTFPAATAVSKVTIATSNRRAFIDNIAITVEGESDNNYILKDFSTGNVSSYQLTGLPIETTYFYTVKPKAGNIVGKISNEIAVTLPDSSSLNLAAYFPEAGAKSVDVNTAIFVTFEEFILIPGHDFSGITIVNGTTNYFTGATIDGNKLILSHSKFDVGGAVYTVTIPVGTVYGIENDIVWSFTLDNLPLAVSDFTPANGATNVDIQQVISVTVGHTQALQNSNFAGVTVRAAGSNSEYKGSVSIDAENKISITPIATGLPYNKVITVTIPKTAILAQDGYSLHEDIVWSFTTEKFVLVASEKTPAQDATNIPVNAAVTLKLNNAVNINGTPNLGAINISEIMGVSATFNNDLITISHNDFAPNTKYTVTVPKEAVTGLTEDIVWSFTTGYTPINILEVTPANGATNIAVNAEVSIKLNGNPYENAAPNWNLVTIKNAAGNPISSVTVNGAGISGNIYSISHATFASNTVYTVTIPKEALVGLAEDYTWSFTSETLLGVDSEIAKTVAVYPTITSGNVTVRTIGNASIRVTDLTGKLLNVTKVTGVETTISLENYSAGIYFVSVETNGVTSTHKVVKK
jgi:hypothetical protein